MLEDCVCMVVYGGVCGMYMYDTRWLYDCLTAATTIAAACMVSKNFSYLYTAHGNVGVGLDPYIYTRLWLHPQPNLNLNLVDGPNMSESS